MRNDILNIINYFKPKIDYWIEKGHLTRFYLMPDIPHQKLQKAIENYGEGIQADQVLIYYDSTITGNDKKGLILTPEFMLAGLGKKTIKIEIEQVRSLTISEVNLLINDIDINLYIHKKEAAKEVFHMLRVVLFAIKSAEPFESLDDALRNADYLWEHLGSIEFIHSDRSGWNCVCGANNELDINLDDQKCKACFRKRNYVLTHGTRALVARAIAKGEVVTDDITSVFPWFSAEKAAASVSQEKKDAKETGQAGIGCLAVAMVLFLIGIGLLFFRPASWGIPGFVAIIPLALSIAAIKEALKTIREARKDKKEI